MEREDSFNFLPGESWAAWTGRVRALARKCGKSPRKWQLAAEEDSKLAEWAAFYALHEGVRGRWIMNHVNERRAALEQLTACS